MTERERDPAHPTREELVETARSEGLMATEEETDPAYREEERSGDEREQGRRAESETPSPPD
jgi:hypothetical protein